MYHLLLQGCKYCALRGVARNGTIHRRQKMSILRICRGCGFPITDDPRIAREQAVCCCVKPKEGLAAILRDFIGSNKKDTEK